MARTVNRELRERKMNVINEVVNFAKATAKFAPTRVDRFYEAIDEAKELWRTKAYFVQELKRLAPSDVEIISRQRKGTYIVLKRNNNKNNTEVMRLVITNPITKTEKVLTGTEIESLPESAKKVSPSKYPKAIKTLDGVREVHRIEDGYVVKFEDGRIVEFR